MKQKFQIELLAYTNFIFKNIVIYWMASKICLCKIILKTEKNIVNRVKNTADEWS